MVIGYAGFGFSQGDLEKELQTADRRLQRLIFGGASAYYVKNSCRG